MESGLTKIEELMQVDVATLSGLGWRMSRASILKSILIFVSFFTTALTVNRLAAQLDPPTIRFMGDILVGTEFGTDSDDRVCVRWETAPRLSTFGSASHHPAIVRKTVAQINACLPSNRQVEILQPNDETATIKVHFVPLNEFARFAAKHNAQVDSSNWGMFFLRWNRLYEIETATVLIASDKLSGRRLQHFILEEITQSLGLGGDSGEFKQSVFYENLENREYGTALEFTDLDRRAIRFLYERVPPGTGPVQLGVLLERHWRP